MTDREKTIKELEKALSNMDERITPEDVDKLICTAQDALSLLKAQEPLAVREAELNKCVCGNEINRYWHPEFCGFCGKKLEWF
jgi:hypothetical protein